jgi:hypothetical protein
VSESLFSIYAGRRAPGRLELIRLGILAGSRRLVWRAVLIALGIRRPAPRPGELLPHELVVVEPLADTGGAYRPKHRPQDPAKDPAEPNGGESSSRGSDHGWSGCTLSAGADAIAYHRHYEGGSLTPWGGDLRHRQSDLEGGTDLGDVREAWASYGEELTIRTGRGWDGVKTDHADGRAIVIQGEGQVPGAGDFTGGHGCSIAPETRSSDGAWLFGDPLVSDWQWIPPGKIRTWAEAWDSSISYAVSRKPPEPEPEPPPAPPPAPTYSEAELEAAVDTAVAAAEAEAELEATMAADAAVAHWAAWITAGPPMGSDRWDAGSWDLPELEELELRYLGGWDPCAPGSPGHWARELVPEPTASALLVLERPAKWDAPGWTAGAWR